MDWTEAETRLAALERDLTHHQRLAREQQALGRDEGRVAAVAPGPALAGGPGRWHSLGHWLWRRLPVPAAPPAAAGAQIATAPLP